MADDAAERLRDAAMEIEHVGSEMRAGDHIIHADDREEVTDAVMQLATTTRKVALLISGPEEGGDE